jgi:3-oxoacyl-[acyl-carrier-protein] synthase II
LPDDDIVITGIGAVCGGGRNASEVWASVTAGRSAVRPLTRFEPCAGVSTGAPVPGFEGPERSESLALRYGEAAVDEAVTSAGLDPGTADVLVASHHGERFLRPVGRSCQVHGVSELVSRLAAEIGAPRSLTVYGACAGGTLAVGTAYHLLRRGQADIAVAGGTDCMLREYDFMQFRSLYAMSTRNCLPEEASCPFDRRRDGFVMGEGAGFVVLERRAGARRRGVDPLAVVRGFGSSQSAYDLVASPPDARGPALAIATALRSAALRPGDIDYINAHGTSTLDNDWCETRAVRKVFGGDADGVPLSSVKSCFGHAMGAAGAIEIVVSTQVLLEQTIPPTINLVEPDPQCDLDYVPGDARPARVRNVLSNGFGFGGHNAALVLGAA